MNKHIKKVLVSGCLVLLCMGLSTAALAAETDEVEVQEEETQVVDSQDVLGSTRASDYIDNYSAWLSLGPGGKIYISFDIDAAGTMKLVGAKLIALEMKDAGVWKNIKNYSGTVSNGMYAQNVPTHGGTITYQGTVGNDYRAVVTFYAGDSTGGDNRIITTNAVRAKN